MEESIDKLLFNKSLVEDIGEGYFELEFGVLIVVCIIGLASAAIMIIAISVNKIMHSRTNLVLILYLICHAALLITTPQFISQLLRKTTDMSVMHCLIDTSEFVLQFCQLGIMLVLLSNTIMQTEKITDKQLILIICAALGICATGAVLLCGINDPFPIVYIVFLLAQVISFIITAAKDIYARCKAKTHPGSDDQKFRLTVARIYIYILFGVNLIIYFSCSASGLIVFQFIFLTPMFIMMYAYWKDDRYKICITNLFRKRENRRSIDARISFTEASSVNEG